MLTVPFDNSLAPYEKRVIELLRNSKDKRARKLAKKRVRTSSSTTINGCSIRHLVLYANLLSSSEPLAVPRRRLMSSRASLPSLVVPATKRIPPN